ncbi:chemotaxis protein CheW [Halorhodospira halochloris]|uniref:chemotaxis protein CheW n=1 Tax=Halorhodospira halochloris TaxID=1052 RepID=UPI001EE7B46B|nr:chemotaxis protein CheW [Halorhodospira halochloris]MCG5529972.1 chemotaxis protein CheW [Halorhodospira halochloris]
MAERDRRRSGDDGTESQPQKALAEYLDELLADVAEAPAEERDSSVSSSAASSTAASSPASSAAAPQAKPETGRQQRVAEREKLPQMPLPQVEQGDPEAGQAQARAPAKRPTPDQQRIPAKHGGGAGQGRDQDPIPSWAKPWFQAMIFHVGPLRVAVPLVKLHRVLRWEDVQVEPYVSQPAWVHGALYHRNRFVRVVDTAELVLPAKHRPPLQERQHGKLLVVGDGSWALACQEVGDVFRLTPDQIQWRDQQGRHRWLAGTVSERLCALLDTDSFTQLLENEDDLEGALASSLDPGQTVRVGSNSTDFR